LTLLGVFIVAVVWEVFEYVNGFALTHGSYILDTISDILFGLIGSYVALRYSLEVKKK
jgi:tellurite resistance protein TehA-like permease